MKVFDVVDQGHGPTVLFSHGTLLDRTMYTEQTAALADRYRTIAYTSRAGTSEYATDYDLDSLVSDCLEVAARAGIDRFVLVGMSVGGFMAIELALKHPERLAGLVLMDTMADAYTSEEKARFADVFRPMKSEAPISASFAQTFVPIIFGPQAIANRPDLVDSWVRKWRTRPSRSVWGEYNSWIGKHERLSRLPEIEIPTLIVHGEDDNGIDIAAAERMHARIPGSAFARIPGAGHLVTEESPDAVTTALTTFLDALPRW
ncbi:MULTISPECIES: alpha/beta fold hydrolase [unclassified Rhodococcus (in: high G+C Gram-positive bacteria)]|uniref:alpha/beta fold hydrolase n=1 Tax=unclassified Rhodococcus (in: high G+C Gram-positive bacteria) TaxID=192944 RepID=UPI00092982D6|nr:alpha/beta hydrolase [Rhodococcus sp. M8]OLL19952.1 alpha/beta hydrolase [Rhodococcus sp. M8]QPG43794.1 alpha/beta hydrolase [Rhodococcus sp. M8]